MKAVRILALPILLLVGCAHSPAYDPQDPLEPVNRKIYAFNDGADRYVLKPVAQAYVEVTPSLVRKGIGNFFDNLAYPIVLVNDLLQIKFLQFGSDLGRFLLNSTAGFAGLLDVATDAGLPAHNEDFGQTLGYWGIGPGWYLMLPFLGPSSNRDLIGRFGDSYPDPRRYVQDAPRYGSIALDLIDTRARLLQADGFLNEQFDPYIALRTAYLERRENLVYDGNPPQEDFDFGEPADDEDLNSEPDPAAPGNG